MSKPIEPYRLPPNVIEHFYAGGERIAALRGHGVAIGPEEWLASTVARWGSEGLGLTDLGPAGPLHDLVDADPVRWFGTEHVARWGSSPALLLKLLDAGQRLPVHVHPNRRFAATHLGCPFGKTEAWVVLDAPSGGGTVYVGTTRPVARAEWTELVEAQETDAMLALLHPVKVDRGDGVVVPSSTPHAIDAGLLIVELQEPTDFSVLLEWKGFDLDGRTDGHLGLGFDVALDAVRTDAVSADELDRLISRAGFPAGGGGPRRLLPPAADPYFRAWAIDAGDGTTTVAAAFSVVVATDGTGSITWNGGSDTISAGDALVVPHAAGQLGFSGIGALIAQPPAPDAPQPSEAGKA